MAYFVRRLGGETRVNTSVSGPQNSLTFTQLSDGRLLATWTGTGTQPGQEDDYGLFHQVFGADLNRIGGEVRSNPISTGIQRYPNILPLPDGRWACVWTDDIGSNTTTYDGIFVQQFNSTGRIGGETRIDGLPQSPGSLAGTRKLVDGGFMVLWEAESTQANIHDDAIFCQRFDASGNPAGNVTRVNTTFEGRQWVSRFVELSGGAFGVAWSGRGTQPGHQDDDGAYFQRFDANGNAVGSEILINNPTSDITEFPDSSIGLKDGGWVLTYYEAFGSRDQAWQQAFNADGSKRGGSTKLTPEGGTGVTSTQLKALENGKWVTFWGEGESYTSSDLYYQIFNADGSAAGPKSLATASTEGMQSVHSILDLPNGGFIVVWNGKGTQPGQDDTDGYFFQRFDANGAKVGGETRINTTVDGETGYLDIAVLPTGHIVAVWDNYVSRPGQPTEADVFQQVFDPNGNRVGTETSVATSVIGPQRNPILEVLSDGSWIVSWSGNGTQPGQEDADVYRTESGGAFFQRFTLFEGATPPFDLVLVGTKRADKLSGGVGNDKLSGKLGKDALTGGSGQDVFVFDTKPNNKTNLDTIADFSVADDTIWLDNKVFKKLGKKGSEASPAKLNKKFFKVADKAKDKDDYLVYSKKKGILYYDADGSGAGKAVEIAKLSKNLKLTAADFFVI